MRLRISPDMDFLLDVELQGVNENTRNEDIQYFNEIVRDEFIRRLKQAFPEEDFRLYDMEFHVARESTPKAA